ncbi:MAG: PAS domain S-box protein [Candidatus Buchananbacteria bacterium]
MKNPEKNSLSDDLSLILDNINDAIFIHDQKGHFLLINDEACRKLGYQKEELLKLGLAKLDSPKFSKLAPQRMKELEDKGKLMFESEHVTKTGQLIPVEISAKIIKFNGQSVILSVARDITQRRQIEQEAKRQQEEQQTIFDSIPAWIFYKDTENRFVKVNQAFCEVMGKSRQQLEGKSMFELYPKDQAEAFGRDDKAVIKSGQVKRGIIESMNSPQGLLWVKTDKIPYHNPQGKIIGVIGFTVDITEQIKFENSIKEAREFLNNIINAVSDPIFVKDSQHRWVVLNDALCKFLGQPREKLIGKSDYDFFPKKEADVFWQKDEEVFSQGWENINEEDFTDAKGVTHTISTKKNIYINNQKKKFLVGIIRDITEQKKAEEKLAERAEELEKLNKLMVGRELKMIELKEKLEKLSK